MKETSKEVFIRVREFARHWFRGMKGRAECFFCVLEKLELNECRATFRMLTLSVPLRHHETRCMNLRWLAALCGTSNASFFCVGTFIWNHKYVRTHCIKLKSFIIFTWLLSDFFSAQASDKPSSVFFCKFFISYWFRISSNHFLITLQQLQTAFMALLNFLTHMHPGNVNHAKKCSTSKI